MKVIVTRSEPGAGRFAAKLREFSIDSLCEPLLIADLKTDYNVNLEKTGAVAVTSGHAVSALMHHPDFSALCSLPLFAVGGSTAQQAREAGWTKVFNADGDVEALGDYMISKRDDFSGDILYATTLKRTGDLEGKLDRVGLGVETIFAYDVSEAEDFSPSTYTAIIEEEIAAIFFHSTRAAHVFARLIEKCDLYQGLNKISALSLSDPVASPLKELGFDQLFVAKRPNDSALLELLETVPAMAENLSDG